jgi:putative membrane protein
MSRVRAWQPLLAALAAAQVAYGRAPREPSPGATRAIVGLMLVTSAAEAAGTRPRARRLGLVGAAGAIGFATELAGVATGRPFGEYGYSDRLGPRVGGVPLLAAAAWAMLARPAWVVAGLLAPRRRAARAALAAGALTAWDVFLDPRMVREGYWSWPRGGRYEGVPASNFLGWLLTAAGVFAVFALADRDDDPSDGDGALALYAWTWVGETVANAALWRRPRVALAGGAAMGAFAVPALIARGRRR